MTCMRRFLSIWSVEEEESAVTCDQSSPALPLLNEVDLLHLFTLMLQMMSVTFLFVYI